jgi:hypothetical protein
MQYIKTEGLLIDTVNKEFNVLNDAISLSSTTTKKEFNLFDKEGIALDVINKKINVLTDAISLSGNTKQFNVFGTEGINLDVNNKNISFLNGVISFSSDVNVNNFKAVDNGTVGKSCVGIVNNGNTTLDTSVSITTTNSTVSSNSLSVNSKNSISKHDSISLLGDSNTLANSSINILGKNNILNNNSILFNSNNSTVSSGSVQINGNDNFVDNNSLSILGSSNFVTNSSTNIASNNNKIYNNSLNIDGFNNLVSSNSVALNSFDSNLRDTSLAINTFNSGLSTNSILINSRNTTSRLSSINLLGNNNTLNDRSVLLNGSNNTIATNSLAFNTDNSSVTGNSVVLGGNSNIVNDFSFVVASSASKAYQESSVIGGKGNTASLSAVAIGSVNTQIIGQNSQSIGGSNNDFNSSNSVFLGGQNNASANVPNGISNGNNSFIIGGNNNKTGNNGIIIGGKDNSVQNNSIVIGGSGNNTANFSNVTIIGRNSVVVNRDNVVYLPEIISQGNLTITGNITAGGNITSVNTVTGNVSAFNINNFLYDIVPLQVDQNKTPLVGTLDSARFNYFGQPRLYVNNQGVSINTSSSVANQALTISGNVSASGNLKLDNTLLIGSDTNLYRSATNTLKTDNTLVVGNITVPTTLATGSTNNIITQNAGTLQSRIINSRVWDTAATFLSGSGTTNTILKSTGPNTIGNSSITDNGSTVSVTGNLNVDSNTLYVDSTNNRIGVLTTTPNETLTVSGNISATGNLTVNGNVVLGSDSLDTLTFNGGPVNFPNATSVGDAIVLGGDANLYRDSANSLRTNDNFVVDGFIFANGSIAATNTSYPQYILRGDTSNNNRWAMWIDEITPTSGKPLIIGPQNTSGTGNGLLTLTRTSSSTNAVGNVGIGTSSPNERLTVLGNISASSNITASNFVMGTQANKATLTYTTNASRTYTIPDAGANADFVMNAGNQTIAGTKTFSSNIAGSITGNAGTATKLQTARTINDISFDGTSNISISAIKAIDNRTVAPSAFRTTYASVAFGTWNNNNASPYSDNIILRTWSSSGGGNDNMISIRKDAIGMRLWQASFGSNSPFSTYKDIAFTDGTNATGTWPISVTGNAATATILATSRTIWGQSFNGSANISGNITGAGTIQMGTQTNKATLTYTTNTARTYTIPNAGANADFVMNAGNQTIAGIKTFSGNTTFPNGAAATPSINFTGSTSTGFYFATNQVSTTIAGTERFRVSNAWTYTPKLLVNTTTTSTEVFRVEGDSRLKDTYINSSGQEILISTNYRSGSSGRNIYIGNGGEFSSGTSSSFGSFNTSLGVYALSAITTGRFNTAIGYASQQKETSGQYNTSVGYSSLGNVTDGQQNTAVGYDALRLNTGSFNTAIGSNAMDASNDPFSEYNTAVGCNALEKIIYGYNNTAIGANAMREGTDDDGFNYHNTAVGANCLLKCSTGNSNTAIGSNAASLLTSGSQNSLVGIDAGANITSGGYNNCIGAYSGYSITSGDYNIAIGSSMYGITTGYGNIAIGSSALNGTSNVSNNVAIGINALIYVRSSSNTAVGYNAGSSIGSDLTTSSGVTYIGNGAGAVSMGSGNTAVGDRSLNQGSSSSYNTSIGRLSLYECDGSYNIGIGANAGRMTGTGGAALTTGTNNILIGQYARPSVATGTYQIVIGDSLAGKGNNTAFIGGTGGAYNGKNTTTWVTTCDKRIKKNITDNSEGLNKIKSIRVRNFEYKKLSEIEEIAKSSFVNKEGIQLGVIAQEFKEILPDCVNENESGILSVNTDPLVWYLINAVKELTERLEKLEGKIK